MPNDPFEDAFARIMRKLDAVREADPTFAIYGASQHRYRLNPCLSETEVAGFENRLGISLPADYRAFVLRLGNGGAGPDNGLYALNTADSARHAALGDPFPVSMKLAREVLQRPKDERYLEPFEDDSLPGCLETTDSGCGTFSFLVVTGEQRGFMWGSGGMCEWIPCLDESGQQMSFLTWYEDWFDYCLKPGIVEYWSKLSRRE